MAFSTRTCDWEWPELPVLGATNQKRASPQRELSRTQAASLLGKGSRALTPGKGSQGQVGVGRWRRAFRGGPVIMVRTAQCSAMCQHGATLGKSVYFWSLGFLH